MNTLPLHNVPNTWGAWDSMVAAARQQRLANESQEAETAARAAQNVDDLRRLLAAGNLEAPVFFLPRSKPVRADRLWEVLVEASTYDDFHKRLVTLLFFASEGCPVTDYARELLQLMVQRVAEVGAEQ